MKEDKNSNCFCSSASQLCFPAASEAQSVDWFASGWRDRDTRSAVAAEWAVG